MMKGEKMENEQKYDLEVPSPLESDKLIEIAQFAEKRIEAVKKIKTMALRLTNAHDWTDQGGKPYLQVSGSEKIARLFGISWRFLGDIERKDEEGGHFSFEVSMEFVMAGASIEFRGSRSSKDPFFSRKHDNEIPPSEIDKTDVMKAAITNTIGNGITRLLGIRNLAWEDLAGAGIKQEDVGRVVYKKKDESQTEKPKQGTDATTGTVREISQKSGQSDKGAYTKYTIQIDDHPYSTFDKKFFEIAKQAKEQGIVVDVDFKTTKFGREIVNFGIKEPGGEG